MRGQIVYDDGAMGTVSLGEIKKVQGRLAITHKSRVIVLIFARLRFLLFMSARLIS